MQHFVAPVPYKCTLAARRHSKNARTLLVLRAVRRQPRAMYVILTIFERKLFKYGKYLVREIITVSLLIGRNADRVRFVADVV